MEVRVDDRVALVTGATRGIGLAVARELLASGARGVVITGRNAENLDAAVEALGRPDQVRAVMARADSAEGAALAAGAAVEAFGACDILVNNAGTNPAPGPLTDVDVGAVQKTWAVNQLGPLIYVQEVWRRWMSAHGGAIVNVASAGGFRPSPVTGAYNISKAALAHFTRQLAMELAPRVRVNAVAPAIVKTRLSEMLWLTDESAAAALHPLERLGEPEDVANAVVFLCSDRASWITGVVLPVDGGLLGAASSGMT
ncbi:MAG TPA: SDR family oxidoreductase [Acidimicrobiia bacterium]